MMIKQIYAALAGIGKKGLDKMQSSAASVRANALNYHSVNTLDPSRLAQAFALADQGQITDQAALFELVEEQDAHLFAELAKRRRAVTGLGWQLEPPKDASQAEIDKTAELQQMIRSITHIEDAQYDLTDAIGKGIAALEIEWGAGHVWLPKELHWVPQRCFDVDRDIGDLRYLKDGIPEALRPWGWVVHEHRAKSGYIEQAALFRVLAWTYAYKAYNVRDMQRFLEVYGLPLRLGKYPAGLGDKQRNELLRAVRNIGHDGAGIVPQTMSIDFIQASKTGTVADFLDAIAWWEKKQSLAILGSTLTSQADGKTSTNALGQVHDKVRREIMLHDVRQIEPTLSAQLVKPIALINGMFPENRIPTWKYLTEETVDQGKMADVLQKSVDMGMEIDLDYAHQVMQIPRAKDGAKLLSRSAAPAPADEGEEGLMRIATLANESPDIASAYSAQMAAACAPFEERVIGQIAEIVAESSDFDEALEKIAAMKRDEKNYQAWAQTLAEGMAAANLAGRAAVQGSK